MPVINSGRKHFVGEAIVNGEKVYINVSNGTGFSRVFELMSGVIYSLAKIYGEPSLEDARQDVCLLMLESILKYKPDKKTSLSTFLYNCAKNGLIDNYRKRVKGQTKYLIFHDENSCFTDLDERIDLIQRTSVWSDTWKNIMFRIFVKGEKIADVSLDHEISPWGLTRAIRKKLIEARNV